MVAEEQKQEDATAKEGGCGGGAWRWKGHFRESKRKKNTHTDESHKNVMIDEARWKEKEGERGAHLTRQ